MKTLTFKRPNDENAETTKRPKHKPPNIQQAELTKKAEIMFRLYSHEPFSFSVVKLDSLPA